jgi:hypothetical protein
VSLCSITTWKWYQLSRQPPKERHYNCIQQGMFQKKRYIPWYLLWYIYTMVFTMGTWRSWTCCYPMVYTLVQTRFLVCTTAYTIVSMSYTMVNAVLTCPYPMANTVFSVYGIICIDSRWYVPGNQALMVHTREPSTVTTSSLTNYKSTKILAGRHWTVSQQFKFWAFLHQLHLLPGCRFRTLMLYIYDTLIQ